MKAPFRIVSYNVRYFGHALRGVASTTKSKQAIAAGLAALRPLPDVVCLQEVETVSLRSTLAHRRAHDGETQLEAFMARVEAEFAAAGATCPYDALYFRADAYRLARLPVYTTGLAILVNRERFAIESHNADDPHGITHHHVTLFRTGKQLRICAHVALRDGYDRRLHVFNTHLSLPTPFASDFWARSDKMGWGPNQLHEARALAQFARRHADAEPFVVVGDFNTAPFSPVFEYLTSELGFENALYALGELDLDDASAFPTAGFMRLRMHLDHLFAGGGVRWVDVEGTRRFGDRSSPFHGLSDHVPLIASFALPGK